MRHHALLAALLLVAGCGSGGGGGGGAPATPTLGELVRIDRRADGTGGSEDGFSGPLSADGRYVVFASESGDLLPISATSGTDIFRKDLHTGELLLISKAWGSPGTPPANGSSNSPSISADGSVIAFGSYATNLVPGGSGLIDSVYVVDLTAGTIARASVRSDGSVANGTSTTPAVSGNGRYVVFTSSATNLDSLIPDTNGVSDIFRHDRVSGATIRVSVDALGGEGAGGSNAPSINGDGSRIVFDSAASLVSEDTNAHRDVYLRELTTTTSRTVCLSVDDPVMTDADTVGNGASTFPSISSDGRWVCFLSVASDLTAEDGNGIGDLFLRDLTLETTRRVRQGDGALALDADAAPQPIARVSDGGRYIVFASSASNLVAGDTNGMSDVFVRDRETARTRRVSVKPDGTQNNGSAGVPYISANGTVIVFSAIGDLPGADPVVTHGYAAPVMPASGG